MIFRPKAALADPKAMAHSDPHASYAAAMTFSPERARSLWLTREALIDHAEKEAAFRLVSIDAANLTAGARLHILEPARSLLAEWRQARAPFDRAIEPYLPAINGIRDREARIAKSYSDKQIALQQAEEKLERVQRYISVKEHYETSNARFKELRAAHNNIDANVAGNSPFYWIALLAVGGAEWLINYDVFYMFMGIPALAAGATIIMGVLLAFAAHGHGTLFKQWPHRFGAERRSIERYGDYRFLALSTFSLIVVLMAAGGSRYAAVMMSSAGQLNDNLAGADAVIATHPLRDVLLSLLANVAAWAVGVFIAYMAHDEDPEYMKVTRQYHRWARRYHRFRRSTEDEKRTAEARFDKQVRELEAVTSTQAGDVRAQQELLGQVERHEAAVVEAVTAQVATNAGNYNDVLAQLIASMRGECPSGKAITRYRPMRSGHWCRRYMPPTCAR